MVHVLLLLLFYIYQANGLFSVNYFQLTISTGPLAATYNGIYLPVNDTEAVYCNKVEDFFYTGTYFYQLIDSDPPVFVYEDGK